MLLSPSFFTRLSGITSEPILLTPPISLILKWKSENQMGDIVTNYLYDILERLLAPIPYRGRLKIHSLKDSVWGIRSNQIKMKEILSHLCSIDRSIEIEEEWKMKQLTAERIRQVAELSDALIDALRKRKNNGVLSLKFESLLQSSFLPKQERSL